MPALELIEKAVIDEFGVSRDDLHCHGQHSRVAKSVAVELCCRLSGRSQREVGRYFGYSTDGGVSKQRQRLARLPDPDGRLSIRMGKIEKALSQYIVQV
jgi:chromosomal replication initiation ATPase DnaA